MKKAYIAIDLKSFYASVECVERGLDPLTTNLVVADEGRTEKTICLAVSPSLKAYGIPGRARLYEVMQKVQGKVDYIIAKPRMKYYMRYSARIYNIYLKFVAAEDIFAYSIDEVFIDATSYLKLYKMSAVELAEKMMKAVYDETGVTATAGVGTNMYLAKVAMDIVAKHMEPNKDGARVAELDEMSYRRKLWSHRPITDFWRVGRGYAKRLEGVGIYTMGDVALVSEKDEDFLYKMFGVNAELLIDHAWGYEPCEMKDVKKYRPRENSFSSGQVLKSPYEFKKARVVAAEMAEEVALNLLAKGLMTNQVVLTVGYDKVSMEKYDGEVVEDFYGRVIPKHAHGTFNLPEHTSSTKMLREAVLCLFDKNVDVDLLIRRITISVNHVLMEEESKEKLKQLSLFDNFDENIYDKKDNGNVYNENGYVAKKSELAKERRANEAILKIKRRYGKNAILKGINFEEGATGRERNAQVGGHRE